MELNEYNKIEDEITIDLKEVFLEIIKKWYFVLFLSVFIGSIGAAYNAFFVKNIYEADGSICITNNDTTISFQDIQLNSALTDDYTQIITSRKVLKKVIENLGLNINYYQLKSMISIDNPSDTHMIYVTVKSSNPEDAVIITNQILEVSESQIYRILNSSEPSQVDNAELEFVKNVKPSLMKYGLVGFIIGIVISCGFILLRVIFNSKITKEADVNNWIELPVLSKIPYDEFEDLKKNYTKGAKDDEKNN